MTDRSFGHAMGGAGRPGGWSGPRRSYNWIPAVSVAAALVVSPFAYASVSGGEGSKAGPTASTSTTVTAGAPQQPGTTPQVDTTAVAVTVPAITGSYESNANARLAAQGQNLAATCNRADPVQDRVLREYGAIFVAQNVKLPPTCLFADEGQVSAFASTVDIRTETLGGIQIRLQRSAMDALFRANEQAGGRITPRGSDASARTFGATVVNWRSRVEPALSHWVSSRRLQSGRAAEIRALAPGAQVAQVLTLEAQGMFFSTGFDKTILASVAAPGTSQHISLLALDVAQNDDPAVRGALAAQGWHQTVVNDLPHFTYLGATADQLPSLGLRPQEVGGRTFWVPNL